MGRVTATDPEINLADATTAVESARRALDEAQALLERARKPKLQPPSTSVIRFAKRFRGSTTLYNYAALQTGGLWYLTGAHSPQGITWRKLAEFIAKDNLLDTAYVELDDADNSLPF